MIHSMRKKRRIVDEESKRDQFPFPSSSFHQKENCDDRRYAHTHTHTYKNECMLFACREHSIE
jgi:hypothetical protein